MHYFTDSFVIRYISNKNKTNINITNTQTIPKIQNFKKAKDKIRNNVLNVKKINLKGVSEMKWTKKRVEWSRWPSESAPLVWLFKLKRKLIFLIWGNPNSSLFVIGNWIPRNFIWICSFHFPHLSFHKIIIHYVNYISSPN